MNLTLTRKEYRSDGIFSELTDEDGNVIAQTVEHAYESLVSHDIGDGEGITYSPKLPIGTYTCVRGQHRLHSGPIETFEITGVLGHSGVLFHYGNTQQDSDGCVIVGQAVVDDPQSGVQMVTNSRTTFMKLMELESERDEFQLTVQ